MSQELKQTKEDEYPLQEFLTTVIEDAAPGAADILWTRTKYSMHRNQTRKRLASHFGGAKNIPNLRNVEVEKLLKKPVYRRSLTPKTPIGVFLCSITLLLLLGLFLGAVYTFLFLR